MKYRMLFLFLFSFVLNTVHAYEEDLPEVKDVIQLSDFHGELTTAFFDGEHPELALELKEGTLLPIRFVINMGWFSIEDFPSLKIRVNKSCWIRFTEDEGYLSEDLESWVSMDEQGCLFCNEAFVNFDRETQQFSIVVEQVECDCDDEWDLDWDD